MVLVRFQQLLIMEEKIEIEVIIDANNASQIGLIIVEVNGVNERDEIFIFTDMFYI